MQSIQSIDSYGALISNSATIKKDEAQSTLFQDTLENAIKNNDDKDLKKACVEYEGYFIQMMFKEMRKTIDTEGSLIPKSQAEQIFQEMLDEEFSKDAANAGGIGLADTLYKQLSRNTTNKVQ